MSTIYENAVFWTLDPKNPRAESVLVSAGRIVFIGDLAECRLQAGTHSSVDLGGAHVVPGFADTHIHTAQLALQDAEIDLSPADSAPGALLLVAAAGDRGKRRGEDGWIFGGRWNHRAWKDKTLPNRHQLDAVTGGRPAAMHHSDLHTYWMNTAALNRLGIDRFTPDPLGGSILRDDRGEPTGILLEAAAFEAQRRLEAESTVDLQRLLPHTLRGLLRRGITSIHDIDGVDALTAFARLHASGELPVRVSKLMPVAALDHCISAGMKSGDGDEWLKTGGVKIFADGSLSSETCLMHRPYGTANNHGTAVTPRDTLETLTSKCHKHGLSVAIHAIGDRAVTHALDAITASRSRSRGPALPDRIEHVQHLAVSDLARIGLAGTVAVMQPSSCISDIDLVESMLPGHEVLSYAWQSILQAGGRLAFSSDAPVEEPNPFHWIFAATERRRADATRAPWQPEQALSLIEAFRATSVSHAYASGESSTKGSLRAGNLADFAVLDRNPMSATPQELRDTAVTMTVVGGDPRWTR